MFQYVLVREGALGPLWSSVWRLIQRVSSTFGSNLDPSRQIIVGVGWSVGKPGLTSVIALNVSW